MDGAISTQGTNNVLQSLTDSQREAVEHIDGPLLILAGPGSGKTRVITHRVANLLEHGIPARNILALTFTNKAADEMRLRLDRLAPQQPVWMGTFHRFCARLLRQHASLVGLSENYTIYDTDDSKKALTAAINSSDVKLTHYTPDQVARAISWAKNELITPADYKPKLGSPLGAIVAKIYPVYQRQLLEANAVDFDDLLVHVALLLRHSPELRGQLDARYRYILVDEYQDTNLAQYTIVRALSVDHPNLAVTGDPDQSIYGWRGANLNNILEFENDFPDVRVVRLEQNYRSTKNILNVAQQLISHNLKRKEKDLFTENPTGLAVRLVAYPSYRDEAEHVAARIANEIHQGTRRPRDIAIFYRVNSLSRSFEHSLRDHGVPYQILKGLEFYQRKEVKDVIAYLRLLNNPRDNVAMRRIINTPRRGIGRTTLDRLNNHAEQFRISLLDAAREAGLIESLSKRSAVLVAKFVAMYDRLAMHRMAPVEEIMGHVLVESGYREQLQQSDAEEDEDRLANIDELLNAAREFDQQNPDEGRLEEFLEQASLVSDTDDWETETDRVTLMTLHAAKGLEFPVVYIVALENDILPHQRSADDPNKVEEERRLLFVGITRAEEELQLSLAQYRAARGGVWPTIPSDFLMELPRAEMDVQEPAGGFDDDDPWAEEEFADEPHDDLPNIQVTPGPATLMTAAEMHAGVKTRPRVSPDAFQHGMLVNHPDYGLGRIVALSGAGKKRRATIDFAGDADSRTILLAFSDLQPVT